MNRIICIGIIIILASHCNAQNVNNYKAIDSLAKVYYDNNNLDSAILFSEKSLELAEKQFGKEDTNYCNVLSFLVELCYYKGNFKKGIDYALSEKSLRLKFLGEKHQSYAVVLNNLAELYRITGDHATAEPLYKDALKIDRELYGEKSVEFAIDLNNLALLYQAMENYFAAEPLFVEALNIDKMLLGTKSKNYAIDLNNLAVLYKTMGNNYAAKPLFEQVLKTYEDVFGINSKSYANALNNYAVYNEDLGNYAVSEQIYNRVIQIDKEILGEKHPTYAADLNNLALLYKTMGNFPAAENLFYQSLNIKKETLGENHPSYTISLNNIAELYRTIGNYSAAEPIYKKVLEIRKSLLGENHSSYAASLNNLALLYQAIGNYSSAEILFEKAVKIWKLSLGELHPLYAKSLNNLANLYYEIGNFTESEQLFIKTNTIRLEILGERHPDYINSLQNQAQLYSKQKRYSEAEPLYLNSLKANFLNIKQNFSFLSEQEKEFYFNTQQSAFNNFYAFALERKSGNPAITKSVYNYVIRNKGLLLKSSTAMRFAILNSNDSLLIKKYNQWISMRKDLDNQYRLEISKRTKNIEELEQQVNFTEKELVRRSQAFSNLEKSLNITWESIRDNLKPTEAAIEFVRFVEKKDTIIYCALIIKPNSIQPEMIKLCEEKFLELAVKRISDNDLTNVQKIYGTKEAANQQIYQLIWQPMEKYLQGIESIYYSPDGLLHKISFSAIAKNKNTFLCNSYNLMQQSSTSKVVLFENFNIGSNLITGIYGGIEYSTDTTTQEIWQYLPGTRTESEVVKKIFESKNINTNYFSGFNASEQKFKEIATSCNFLHIASHGFFYPNPSIDSNFKEKRIDELALGNISRTNGFGLWQFAKNKNPLMRSGIALANANNVWNQRFNNDDDDGVLTAMEVTQLNLQNTQLVVLSACETGLGDIRGSEGVYGLQRAFKMAGVKYIIMSLWQVPDKETVEFMTTFYTKLLKQKDIRKAFIETQNKMQKKYDPYYWAAFVLIE